jgi:hypothetical protein
MELRFLPCGLRGKLESRSFDFALIPVPKSTFTVTASRAAWGGDRRRLIFPKQHRTLRFLWRRVVVHQHRLARVDENLNNTQLARGMASMCADRRMRLVGLVLGHDFQIRDRRGVLFPGIWRKHERSLTHLLRAASVEYHPNGCS